MASKQQPIEVIQYHVQTIEKRSKKLKGRLVAFMFIMIIGVLISFTGMLYVGVPLTALGILGLIFTQIAIWWHHS